MAFLPSRPDTVEHWVYRYLDQENRAAEVPMVNLITRCRRCGAHNLSRLPADLWARRTAEFAALREKHPRASDEAIAFVVTAYENPAFRALMHDLADK